MYATFSALAVLALLQAGQPAGELKFRPPPGWRHEALQDGKVALQPADVPPGKTCVVFLVPAADGDLGPSLDQAWARAAAASESAGAKVLRRGTPVAAESSGGFATRSMTAVLDEAGKENHLLLFAVKAGPKVRTAMYMADDEAVFKSHLADVKAMLDSAYLTGPPTAAQPPAGRPDARPDARGEATADARRPAPAPDVGKAAGAGLTGVYYVAKVQFNPSGNRGDAEVKVDYMCFSPDGRVYWGKPVGGPLEVFENEFESPYFGRYEMKGGALTVVWGRDKVLNQQLSHTGKRTESGGVEVNGTQYRPMNACDGMKLDGTYAWASGGKEWSRIEFTRDGRFAERGLKEAVSDDELARPRWPKLPGAGAGVYSIRQNTLEVRYDRGPTRRIFFTTTDDPQRPGKISINGYPYERRQ